MAKRITDLPEGTLEAGDYIVADREDGATKKVPLHDTLSAYVTGEGLETALEPYATETSLEQLTRTASGTVATAATAYAGAALRSVAVKGRSVQDGTPTPDAPVAIESVEDMGIRAVTSRNILDEDNRAYGDTRSSHGITIDYEGDGWWHVTGTRDTTSAFVLACYGHESNSSLWLAPAGTYRVSAKAVGVELGASSVRCQVGYVDTSGTSRFVYVTDSYPVTCNALKFVRFHWPSNGSVDTFDCRVRFHAEVGSVQTPWTPYVGTSSPLDLDGHALRSLPDGTCDEAVWTAEGGTLTQRVGYTTTAASDGVTGTVGVDVMSSTGQIADGADVLYKLAEPLTHTLPTSPLPEAPAADMAVWAECEPSTEVEVVYRESIQLAVDEIREAIASIV